MQKLLSVTWAIFFIVCSISTFADQPKTETEKLEKSTRLDFAGKKIHVTGGATHEFKRDMTGIKYGGGVGKFVLPFKWWVEGEFAVTKGAGMPGASEQIVYWKFTKKNDVVAGRTKEQPTFTATASR